PEQAAAAVAEIKAAGAPDAKFFEGDLRDADKIASMMKAVAAWAPIDILVNNAGIQKTVTLAEADAKTWDAVIAINLSACFHTSRLALPAMAARGYGRVINIASVHGLVASVAKAPYVSAKFGLVGMTKVAALEYADAGSRETGGVTVNAICPGWVETPLIEPQIMAMARKVGGDRAAGVKALVAEKQPSGRTADPADIGAVELCASPSMHDPAWRRPTLSPELQWSDQGEGELGERMARAAKRWLDAGQPLLLIGTDCPELDCQMLQTAAQSLSNHDAAIAPTADGGYALLGLNRFDATVFDNIRWSTDTVARETLSRLETLGWTAHRLPSLHDIDEAADLKWIPEAWRDDIEQERPTPDQHPHADPRELAQ
ncbi:MAG: hypothetical protein CVU28_08425, partial [Betaproteobacteria bacterium HGW-Betaproteobacteria-21]